MATWFGLDRVFLIRVTLSQMTCLSESYARFEEAGRCRLLPRSSFPPHVRCLWELQTTSCHRLRQSQKPKKIEEQLKEFIRAGCEGVGSSMAQGVFQVH